MPPLIHQIQLLKQPHNASDHEPEPETNYNKHHLIVKAFIIVDFETNKVKKRSSMHLQQLIFYFKF